MIRFCPRGPASGTPQTVTGMISGKRRYPKIGCADEEGTIRKRQVLTRAESQALTRDALLDAGEELLLEAGYHSTSLAAIAGEAGRTIGAVYSNYASKEELCLEILKRRLSVEVTALMAGLTESDDDLESRLNVVGTCWARLSADPRILLLAAEFMLTTMRQPAQLEQTVEAAERVTGSVRALIEDHLPPEAQAATVAALDRAVHGIVAAGVGLVALQSLQQIDAAESADMLVEVIRMWLDKAIAESSAAA